MATTQVQRKLLPPVQPTVSFSSLLFLFRLASCYPFSSHLCGLLSHPSSISPPIPIPPPIYVSFCPTHPPSPLQVKLSVLITYCRACSYFLSFLTILFFVCMNGASIASNFWLADWSNSEDATLGLNLSNTTYNHTTACDRANGPDMYVINIRVGLWCRV